MARADEQQHFVQCAADVVVPGGQKLGVVVVHTADAVELHCFRQVDMPSAGVLGVDRRYHHTLAQQQLVLHLAGIRVSRKIKAQGPEVTGIFQCRLHEGTIKVGQQGIPQPEHLPQGRQHIRKAVVFLHPGAVGGVVAHQRREQAELQPAQSQIGRSIVGKTAQVGTGVQKAAQLHVGHHLDIGQKLCPCGSVVTQPDAAVAVAADEAGTAVEQRASAGPQAGKGFACRTGHIAAVEVVHPVMAHPLAVHIVVEAGVVLGGVHQAQRAAHHLAKELILHDVVLPAQFVHALKESLEPLG